MHDQVERNIRRMRPTQHITQRRDSTLSHNALQQRRAKKGHKEIQESDLDSGRTASWELQTINGWQRATYKVGQIKRQDNRKKKKGNGKPNQNTQQLQGKCFRFGSTGHKSNDCKLDRLSKCLSYGKAGHIAKVCSALPPKTLWQRRK